MMAWCDTQTTPDPPPLAGHKPCRRAISSSIAIQQRESDPDMGQLLESAKEGDAIVKQQYSLQTDLALAELQRTLEQAACSKASLVSVSLIFVIEFIYANGALTLGYS